MVFQADTNLILSAFALKEINLVVTKNIVFLPVILCSFYKMSKTLVERGVKLQWLDSTKVPICIPIINCPVYGGIVLDKCRGVH